MNVGLDIEEVERWRGLSADNRNDLRFSLFTDLEHRYCSAFPDPAPHYCARWCAKEAARKAFWPMVKADLRRIEVRNDSAGLPCLDIDDLDFHDLGIEVSVSLTHAGAVAAAVVVVQPTSSLPAPREL